MRRARRRRCIRWWQNCHQSASSSSSRRCARMPICRLSWRSPPTTTPASSTTTTSPAAAAASRSMCRNIIPPRAWPLVMALHGGSGNGRGFLWSWLRDARSHGAILVAPTATADASNSKTTWALTGDDTDTPNLLRILDSVRSRWNVDATKMLLTGMSDGGTFCYVSGLEGASPFTHLAPVAATFHPLMAEMADADRLRGLPIYLVHGRLDWMFPVQVARQTHQLLSAAGANVTYREIDDLSHCYPREINAEMLAWLRES